MKRLLHSFTKKDFRVDFYRGHGAGGQHRNKTDSCCRITHIPTGLVGNACEQKEQGKNKKVAFKRLSIKLLKFYKQEYITKTIRNNEVIRSYNQNRNEVSDKRSARKFDFRDVLLGDGLQLILDDILQGNDI